MGDYQILDGLSYGVNLFEFAREYKHDYVQTKLIIKDLVEYINHENDKKENSIKKMKEFINARKS